MPEKGDISSLQGKKLVMKMIYVVVDILIKMC